MKGLCVQSHYKSLTSASFIECAKRSKKFHRIFFSYYYLCSILTDTMPYISGIPQGHTGNVKVLTCVEMTPGVDNNVKLGYNSVRARYTRRSLKTKDLFNVRRQSTSAALTSKLFVISGGYGYENFKTTSSTEVSGRDDSTNHLLLWQV